MKRKREIATGLLFLAIATVFGQDPPPTDPGQTDPAQEGKTAKAPEEPKASVILGWSSWGLRGNENKFRQYATAPKDLFIREMSFAPTFRDRHDAFLQVKAPWQDDYRFEGAVRLNNGTTYLAGSDQRNKFFNTDPSVLNGNQRAVASGEIRQSITPNFGLAVASRMDQQDVHFPAPLDPLHQRTRTSTATAQGSLWKDGFVSLNFTDWQYWDRTNILSDTNMKRWSAGISQDFGDRFSLRGSYSNSRIEQIETNRIEAWTFGGQFHFDDATTLFGEFRNERLSLPTVDNAYVRNRDVIRGRVVHRFGAGWTGQLGYSHLAIERVNATQTFVDVPKWHNFDLQVSGRLSPSVRLTAKAARSTMQGGAGMETTDTRALYWRNRWSGEIKFDASSELINGYLSFGFHDDRNDVRDVRVRNQNITFGAAFQAKPELELYFESSTDLWSGNTSDPLAPDLNAFFPDGTTFTMGANWTINDRAYATANYSLFRTFNDNPLGLPDGNVRGNFFTGSFNYRTPLGFELGLTLAPWQYSDRLYPGLGYTTGMVQLSAKGRF